MSDKPIVQDGVLDTKPEDSHVEDLRRQQTNIYIDPQLDKRLDRKFDSHIVPWLFGIW